MSASLVLLKKIRCRFLFKDTGQPAPGIVTSLQIVIGDPPNHLTKIPAGTLCSDTSGYVSFDIKALLTCGITTAYKLLVSSPAIENGEIDLLSLLSTNANSYDSNFLQGVNFVDALSNEGCDFYLVFPVYVSRQESCEKKHPEMKCHPINLPAIQSPDVSDYSASPFSFVSPTSISLGNGSCETLVPTSLPLQEHRFYKVIVRREENEGDLGQIEGITEIQEVDLTVPLTSHAPKIKFAEVIEFKQQWFSLGHSLGEIKYSLALAPGEATQVAIIDWSRQDNISRTDNVVSSEFMDHSLKRDRSIEETIDSALRESQGGSSFMAGTTGQATIPLQYVTLSFNHAIGYGVSNSWGNRNLEADSLQDLHDKIRQRSGYTRSLNSTVVIQASQAEQNVLQTRKIANHNHCHALTIQYYEVLRHFKIRSVFAGRKKAILIPFKPFKFTWEIALKFRSILETSLIDQLLKENFDAIYRFYIVPTIYDVDKNTGQDNTGTSETGSAQPKLITKLVSVEGKFAAAVGTGVVVKNNDDIRITAQGLINFAGTIGEQTPNGKDVVTIDRNIYVAPELTQFSLIYKIGTDGTWKQAGTFAIAKADRDGEIILAANDEKNWFGDNSGAWSVTIQVPSHEVTTDNPSPNNPTTSTTKNRFVREFDELSINRLLMHLNGNQGYYNGAVWVLQNPIERRLQMELALSTNDFLLDAIDDVPLAVSGNYLAFAYDGPLISWLSVRDTDPDKPIEDIVTLPTRGVFAEAMLGHCDSCEERDPARRWDWKEMTIEEPPSIAPVTQGPQGQPLTVTPAQLPANVIQIAQPPAAPDPTGLAAALKVLGTPDIFRDMSGLDEVSGLLKQLSEQSSEANTKALAKQAQDKLDKAKESNKNGSSSVGTTNNTRSPATETDAAKQVDRLKAIEYAKDNGLINDQEAQNATKSLLGGDEIASSDNLFPADQSPRKGVFPINASIEDKIKKVLIHFGDADFSSASNINQIFSSLSNTSISGYIQWLDSRKNNLNFIKDGGSYNWVKDDGAGKSKIFKFNFLAQSLNNFDILWDGIPEIYGPNRDSINLIEFLALDLATHIEGYGDYAIVSEAIREGYGLDYFFEPNWVSPKNKLIRKLSYNTLTFNRTAGSLFADTDFRTAHDDLLPTTGVAWRLVDPLWNGADYFATQAPASIISAETAFIRQADFYKFRGRGYIQTTNRANYKKLARILRQNLNKLPSPLWSLVESWGPENPSDDELDVALTSSRDIDWSNLFEMTGGIVAFLGIRSFSEDNSNCLNIDFSNNALINTNQGTVAFLGNKINGYGSVLSAAVRAILVEMYDSLS